MQCPDMPLTFAEIFVALDGEQYFGCAGYVAVPRAKRELAFMSDDDFAYFHEFRAWANKQFTPGEFAANFARAEALGLEI